LREKFIAKDLYSGTGTGRKLSNLSQLIFRYKVHFNGDWTMNNSRGKISPASIIVEEMSYTFLFY
jgi:hypothetical protein